MTKIAFFDVDGTMINVPHQLLKPTKRTIEALKDFQKQGNYIVEYNSNEIIYTSGIKDKDGNILYKLSDIEKVK